MSPTDGDRVRRAFDASAPIYDRARRQLVPCFDDFYGTLLETIPFDAGAAFRVLDLGAGTGLLALLISERFPHARITLVDISTEMLAKARERFGSDPRFELVAFDYSAQPLPADFEVVASALSIHHLTDPDKARLFHEVHRVLVPGGVFVDADLVLGPTAELECVYHEAWLRHARERGVSAADLEAALVRAEQDRLAPLDANLRWLTNAGFEEVDCFYKRFRFAVFAGRKPRGGRT